MPKETYKGKKSTRKPRRNQRYPRPRKTFSARPRQQTGITQIEDRQHVVPPTIPVEPPVLDQGGNEHEAQGVPQSAILAAEMRGNWESQMNRAEGYASCRRRTLETVRANWVGEKAFDVIKDIEGVLNAKK